MRKTTVSRKRKNSKTDWYQKGRESALMYWRNMTTEPEREHIVGHIAVALEEALVEAGRRDPTEVKSLSSEYIKGLGVGLQEGIEDLMKRAAIFDGIVRAVKEARHA